MMKKKILCLFICFLITSIFPVFSAGAFQTPMENEVNISIGAGMIRLSIAGFSHTRRIGLGTNIRVENNGNESKEGNWELVYSDFSDNIIKNKKGNFTISPDELLPYLKGIIIYTSLEDRISKVSMSVEVDDYKVTRTGIRIGPLVIFGRYNT